MDLEIHLVPDSGKSSPVGRKWFGFRGGHVKIVDPFFHRKGDGLFNLLLTGLLDGTGPQSQDADLVPAVGKCPILHVSLPPATIIL